ncbi:hypothetical protein JCM10213_000494 [Rhodosporidiobolus nylandii]
MKGKRTSSGFAADLTNQQLPSSSSSSFAAPSPSSRRPLPPSAWRQTSLSDLFVRPASPPSAAPPSTPATASTGSSDDALFTRLRSTPATSPTRASAGKEVEMEELSEGEDASERATKRRRVVFEDEPSAEEEEDDEGEPVARLQGGGMAPRLPSTYIAPGQQMSAFEAVKRRELGFRTGAVHLSMRPVLRTVVSSNEDDVTRIPSQRNGRNFAPPFALRFTNTAKQGGKKLCAVADEEGMVSFLSAEEGRWTRGPTRHSFQAHDNAIFDLAWSGDDQFLATASGDQTTRLWDVRTQTCVGILSGHTCTIKSISWDPSSPHMLSTASRDGSIRVWDRRVQAKYGAAGGGEGEEELGVATVNQIKNAHGVKGKGAKGRSATRSVTGVTYLAHQPNLLASSGSSDSVIKIWDLRRSHSRRVNPASYETNEDAASSLCTSEGGSARPHGIANLTLAPDGTRLYALATDSSIYAFAPQNLTLPSPVRVFSSPAARYNSFYVRAAISPCSRYLASGNSDGGVLLWDTEGSGRDAVRVVGHEREVSGIDWADGESLATCSDDLLVRHWRANDTVARLRQREAEEETYESLRAKEHWSGEALTPTEA